MKVSKYIAVLFFLNIVSFNSLAATEVKSATGEKMGVISVTGSGTLDSLTDQLSKKADKAGAKYFRIVSVFGQNHLNGVAEIYR
ncbi:MAG: DUF1471 domain-containing protein [Enterobacteriaceae bacterium]|jgi:multiple stress resistance protein BhsA|nr:DUF1471 domain-containing protein [Enterobacteriaceae bacterium]